MSTPGELVNALGDATRVPKTEDSNYNDPSEFNHDLDTDQKPDIHHDEPSAPQEDEDMEDLFGDDKPAEEVIHHEGAITPASSEHVDGISSPERKRREALEYEEDDEPDPIVEEEVLEASAQIPNIPVPRSTDGNHWVIRIPNFIKVDPKPFHPDTYIGPEQEDEAAHPTESSREKDMTIKLRVENAVRWRWVKDDAGQDRRQSNSRIIRWSDGTLSLKLGKELFDITQTIDTSGAVPRQTIGSNAPSSQQPQRPAAGAQDAVKAQGLTYLVAQHKRAEILQCEAMIAGYLSLRPTGMQSETHRMLVRAVGQKHSKVSRLRMAPDPTTDPEREKLELLKQASKKTRKPKADDDGLGGGRRRRSAYARRRHGDDVWSDDDDDDEDAFGGGGGGGSEDEFGRAGPSARKAKRRKSGGEDESSRRGPGEYQNDDFLVADSEEDAEFAESDEDERRRQKKRKTRDEPAEQDDLDKLDAKIEAEERKRRQQDKSQPSAAAAADGGNSAAGDDAMDVESEEDEEEWGVRRAGGTGSRKKRAIDFDDEEE